MTAKWGQKELEMKYRKNVQNNSLKTIKQTISPASFVQTLQFKLNVLWLADMRKIKICQQPVLVDFKYSHFLPYVKDKLQEL